MKTKTKGTIILICGIIDVVCNAAFIVLNLVFKYNFDGSHNILSDSIFFAIGIYLCYLGVKMRKQDK